jgi:cyclic-di-GMP-binding biofilm dispersal mediator protein
VVAACQPAGVSVDLAGRSVLVVGATGGLGLPIARRLAARGAALTASARPSARLDGVVFAAGVVAFGPAAEVDDATLERLLALNVLAPVRLLRAAVPHLVASGEGFAVHVSAVVAEQPTAGTAAYSASKAALAAFDAAAGRELRRSRIRLIDVRPPHTETGLTTRPIAGVPPRLPQGLDPDAVAERIVAPIEAGERDVPASAFAGEPVSDRRTAS